MVPRTLEIAGEKVAVRDAVIDDVALIFPTWIQEAGLLRRTRPRIFNQFYPNVVRALLETEAAVVLTKEGGSTIHAWACGRPPNLLHFAYVPFALRGAGFGRAVISSVLEGYPSTIYVTSSPVDIRGYLKSRGVDRAKDKKTRSIVEREIERMRLVYNPYVMRTG